MYQGYGYPAYSAYPSNGTAASSMGHDRKVCDQQRYRYPLPLFQTHQTTISSQQGDPSVSLTSDQLSILVVTRTNGDVDGNTYNGPGTMRPSHQNLLNASEGNGGYQDSRCSSDEIGSTKVWNDATYFDRLHSPAKFRSSSYSSGCHANNSSLRIQGQQLFPRVILCSLDGNHRLCNFKICLLYSQLFVGHILDGLHIIICFLFRVFTFL